jgi:hypothetical protein
MTRALLLCLAHLALPGQIVDGARSQYWLEPAGSTSTHHLGPQRRIHHSGIRGIVISWPRCAVETGASECLAKRLAASLSVSSQFGQRITTAQAGGSGFKIELPPGDYVLEADVKGMACAPVDVTVSGGRYAAAEVRCDSGVR